MIYVGIDIAKLNHLASVISSDGEILMEPFQFSNDADGFHMFVSRLESDNVIIGLKSTAHYGDNLVDTLLPVPLKCVYLTPSRHLPCVKTIFAKRRRIRSTLTALLKLL